jgi:hypothetical protein
VYEKELKSLENYKESLETIIKSLKIKPLLMHSLFYKLEKESKDKILSINKYVNDNISQEKIEVAIPNLINIIKTLNDNEDAIKMVKGESKFKAKTLIEALYKKLK